MTSQYKYGERRHGVRYNTNRCYQKFEFYAINLIRAKSLAELFKRSVNKKAKIGGKSIGGEDICHQLEMQ